MTFSSAAADCIVNMASEVQMGVYGSMNVVRSSISILLSVTLGAASSFLRYSTKALVLLVLSL